MLDLFAGIDFLLDDGDCLLQAQARAIEQLVCLLDVAARLELAAGARDADGVEADNLGRLAIDDRVWHDILREL